MSEGGTNGGGGRQREREREGVGEREGGDREGEREGITLSFLCHVSLSLSLHAPVNLIQERNENTIHWENHFNTEENTNTKAWIRP